MKKLLTLKHWQLFLLLLVIPLLFQIIVLNFLVTNNDPTKLLDYLPTISVVFMGLFLSWMYTVGVNLHQKLPPTVKMNLMLFKIMLLIPMAYLICIVYIMPNLFTDTPGEDIPSLSFFLVVIPIHLFSMFCIFYGLYFNTKALKAVECQKPVIFNDFLGEFMLMWFFPVGIWKLQPRIKELFEKKAAIESHR